MKVPRNKTPQRVTAENLATLGAERLANILFAVAQTRPDLKRRLRMELAAEAGPAALAAQIDKRLIALETSRGKITWRQKPAVIRDLDALRVLIAERLAQLDADAAIDRLWRFIDAARHVAGRLRERADLDLVYAAAAADLGALIGERRGEASRLVESLAVFPLGWKEWLPRLLAGVPATMAQDALVLAQRAQAGPGWISLVRQLADAAGDPETFAATYSSAALATPSIAAEVALRFLTAGRVDQAGEILRSAAPPVGSAGSEICFDWESAWIDYLERSERFTAAQDVRWASFVRTLSPARLRDYLKRLPDFEDVEAEHRAFDIAAGHRPFEAGLSFLMEWPALPEAARMIECAVEIEVSGEPALLWAAKLRRRYPSAAHRLLRAAAAAAFHRRQYKLCDELTAEADTIEIKS